MLPAAAPTQLPTCRMEVDTVREAKVAADGLKSLEKTVSILKILFGGGKKAISDCRSIAIYSHVSITKTNKSNEYLAPGTKIP